jgi:hypothetical protein
MRAEGGKGVPMTLWRIRIAGPDDADGRGALSEAAAEKPESDLPAWYGV